VPRSGQGQAVEHRTRSHIAAPDSIFTESREIL